jgi:hypothetical protein
MTQSEAEVLILTINALGAGILLFVAGVAQKVMDHLEAPDFKRFANLVGRSAMSDPFAVTVATLPIIAAVPSFVAYRFKHRWLTAGLVAWLVGSSVTKVTNLPMDDRLADAQYNGPANLLADRRKLRLAHDARAGVTLLSVLLMAAQFGRRAVALTIVAAVIVAIPSRWLARKYIPGGAGKMPDSSSKHH